MARRGSAIEVDITEGAIRVRRAGRLLTVAIAPSSPDADVDSDIVLRLDDIEHWDAPHEDVSIEIEELQTILDAIEEQLEKRGLTVAFE
jgi:Immunity protein 74